MILTIKWDSEFSAIYVSFLLCKAKVYLRTNFLLVGCWTFQDGGASTSRSTGR